MRSGLRSNILGRPPCSPVIRPYPAFFAGFAGRRAAAALACALFTGRLAAQTAITSVTTLMTNGTATQETANGETVTFENDQEALINFTAGGTTYYAVGAAQTAIIDRDTTHDTTAPNQTSDWYAYTGSSTSPTYQGVYQTNANTMLLGNNLLQGADNVFVNNDGSLADEDDIERLDFIEKESGYAATTGQAFAVFDRGNDTVHDSFKIAVITAVDSNGNPTAYGGDLITVTAANYDTSSNPVANQNYGIFRYDVGDNLTAWDNNVTGGSIDATRDQNTQGTGGVVLTLAALGITSGTTIYGYSIMGADVYSTSTATVVINSAVSSDLVNYLNTTYYPNDTSDNNTTGDDNYGGIDLMDVNGVEFSTTKVTPEPATYGLVFAGLGLLAFGLSRRRAAGLTSPAA